MYDCFIYEHIIFPWNIRKINLFIMCNAKKGGYLLLLLSKQYNYVDLAE